MDTQNDLRNFGCKPLVIAHYNYIRSCGLSEGHGGHPQHPLKLTKKNKTMSKTSIHIEPCNIGSSEQHNQRLKHLDYVRPELSRLNESWVGVADLPAHLEHLKTLVKEKTGRKMQAKATPIREGVIVIRQDTTIEQLKGLASAIEQRWGIETLQIYTHMDEGHTDSEGAWKPNLHAHIVFDWINHETGKSIKLSRQDMAEMQTMVADCLEMVRGESSDLKHLGAIQFKTQAEEQRLETIKEQTMKEEQAREQAREEAKRETTKTADEILERNQRPVLGPKWGKAWDELKEAYEKKSAQLIEKDRQMTEYGLKGAFKSFWEDCKRWWSGVALESIRSFANLVWYKGETSDGNYTYKADREKGRLLIDGQTIEQKTAPQIIVPSSPVQERAQAVGERKAGQERETDRQREQHLQQERQERRGRKL